MNRILALVALSLLALPLPVMSQNTYPWQEIDSLLDNGLNRSALELAETTYQSAREAKDRESQLKALMLILPQQRQLSEKGDSLVIERVKLSLKETEGPTQSILYVLLAEQYLSYYRNNRYRILNRTIREQSGEDFQTWGARKLQATIAQHFHAALTNQAELIATSARAFPSLIDTVKASMIYRPTLFDVLAHRVLDYYRQPEYGLSESQGSFQPDANLLAPAEQFVKLALVSADSLSRSFRSVRLYQQLLRLHEGEAVPTIDLELKRLAYLRQILPGKETDSTVLKLYQDLSDQYLGEAIAGEVQVAIARMYYERGQKYDAFQAPELQWEIKRAYDLCEQVQKDHPSSRASAQAASLQSQIDLSQLRLQVEEVLLPKDPFRVMVQYQKLDKLYLRLYKVDFLEILPNSQKETFTQLSSRTPLRAWEQALKQVGDYQQHRSEIVVEGLANGRYMLVASSDPNFQYDEHLSPYTTFQVSEIAYYYRRDKKGSIVLQLQNRQTSKPLKDASVDVYKYEYDYRNREGSFNQLKRNQKVDAEGQLTLDTRVNNRDIVLHIKDGEDQLQSDQMYLYNYGYERDRAEDEVFFFMDRKIYRPGQTIYFKGLALRKKDKEWRIRKNKSFEVIFRDVNGQEIRTEKFKSNEFGTFSGSFTAPVGVLTGSMRLHCNNSSISFRVEEYKRPKFEVKIDPFEGEFVLGDPVRVQGEALAFSGVKLDGAKVKYSVRRNARFPYFYSWWRPAPSSPSKEISSGEVLTQADGSFSFDFPAEPDVGIRKEDKPIFSYEVNISVTDITGETHEASTNVQAAYTSLLLDMQLPEKLHPQNEQLSLQVNNLNGQPVPTKVKLKLYQLKTPDRILRERSWDKVDFPLVDSAEFEKLFPHEAYADEKVMGSWDKTLVWQEEVSTTEKALEKALRLPRPEGAFALEASFLDPSGDSIQLSRYAYAFGERGFRKSKLPLLLEAWTEENKAEPGDIVKLKLATAEKRLWVRYMLSHGDEILRNEMIMLKGNQQKEINIPISEALRGGLNWTVSTVSYNEAIVKAGNIDVPWTNKDLQLSWSTFRSKLQPGQQEEWRLNIKGPQGEAVAAEMVATLYDASLDAFAPNTFGLSLFPKYGMFWSSYWDTEQSFGLNTAQGTREKAEYERLRQLRNVPQRGYDRLRIGIGRYGNYAFGVHVPGSAAPRQRELTFQAAPAPVAQARAQAAPAMALEKDVGLDLAIRDEDRVNTFGESLGEDSWRPKNKDDKKPRTEVKSTAPPIRTNLQETAFFFPQLRTDKQGDISLSFTMPEALTRWKFLGLAHTEDLQSGVLGGETLTQKELMVQPNLPRFLREGDSLRLIAKLSNLSEEALAGNAKLEIFDARTMASVLSNFSVERSEQSFDLAATKNQTLAWEVVVPENVPAVVIQISAQSQTFGDGEENVLPVLPNRMLVTESLPMSMLKSGKKTYTFKGLAAADQSSTLKHQSLTLEFSSNPAWYAVQSLPYLMEFPYECTEQIFSRLYANTLASHIANQNPRIEAIYQQWQQAATQGDSRSFMSMLEQNQDLKTALLEETPWVRQANNESERKKRLGLLFDLNRISLESATAKRQLEERQLPNGAFSWFPGMRESRYITQLVVTGIGHLQKLGVSSLGNPEIGNMTSQAIRYLDREMQKDYERYTRRTPKEDWNKYVPGATQIQYLYMRSFFPDMEQTNGTGQAYVFYYTQAEKYWLQQSRQLQGMLALTFHRTENQAGSRKILTSLKENALIDEERGMYWQDQRNGYYWYQSDIERHALLTEAFYEAGGDLAAVAQLKLWLLQNKRTHDWKSTRATVAACNALLATGADWLQNQELVAISLGGEAISPQTDEAVNLEAGTGYFQKAWEANEIDASKASVVLQKANEELAWGAMYWQYFEQMDKIKFASTPLSVTRKLFKVENTPDGEKLMATQAFSVGDKVRVLLEIRADRAMEYVHLKDQRAALFEPKDVLSQYTWQGGLGYYQSTRDLSTNFFFDYLPQGTYVLEYDLYATQSGNASQGISTLQSMYAPEFSAHSEGIRVEVK
ncbi:MAG: alpha-2-macroglobulin family protein [Bacteroidota bacterium]